jgi:hypothetical protein
MASAVAKAQAAQGFQQHPDHPGCGKCLHFECNRVEKPVEYAPGYSLNRTTETLRCGIGQFKVGRTSVCREFVRKEKP